MIINHNLGAMRALSALSNNSQALNSALEKLSTGKKINSAADNASGYAISQKMQAQINGLGQASSNAQDGISMIQTASGALNQTTSILQNMRQLSVQASNSTTTAADRQDLQTQFNQLADQLNNIGNTTQFNTKNLLKGDGSSNLTGTGVVTGGNLTNGAAAYKTQTSDTFGVTGAASSGASATFTINGQTLKVNFKANGTGSQPADQAYSVTGSSASVDVASTPSKTTTAQGIASALTQMINSNSTLKGNYTVTNNAGNVTIQAVAGGQFDGASGVIGTTTVSQGTGTTFAGSDSITQGTNNPAAQATSTMTGFSSIASSSDVKNLVGKGFTINGQQIHFYNANNGPYTGSGLSVNLSNAVNATSGWNSAVANAIVSQVGSQVSGVTLSTNGTAGDVVVTANQGGTAGNNISITDGGVQKNFTATFQIGANKDQTMQVSIGDMRAMALGITGTAGSQGYSQTNNVNNGTNNTNTQAALNITSTTNADSAIKTIDNAVQKVTSEQANLGAVQNRLQSTIKNLGTSQQNLTAAKSGITDVNMAKEMSQYTQQNVLQQASVAMLSHANQQPQLVLKLLG